MVVRVERSGYTITTDQNDDVDAIVKVAVALRSAVTRENAPEKQDALERLKRLSKDTKRYQNPIAATVQQATRGFNLANLEVTEEPDDEPEQDTKE